MPDLAKFQTRFAAAIMEEAVNPAMAALPGFAVYRNTSLSAAIDALAANYPRIKMLLGTEAFGALATGYARTYWSHTPMLASYGATFPDYLIGHPIGEDLPYIADVARVDRMWTEVFFAADAAPLSAEAFAAIDLSTDPSLVLTLHPASRHAWFDSPAAAIWLAHSEEVAEPVEIAWVPGGIHLTREYDHVVVEAVPRPEILFLDLLAQRMPVLESAESLLTECPGVDLAAIVARLLSRGALAAPPPS